MGVAATAVILAAGSITPLLGAALALAWMRWTRRPWRELGFAKPRSWALTLVLGIAFGIAFKLAMKAIVMPLLGAPPVNAAYHNLAGDLAAVLPMAAGVIVGGGFGEETFFRGYGFERLGKLLGTSVPARALTLLITSAWFAAPHYLEQGRWGAEQAAVTGLAFGTLYAATGTLWLPMIVHATFDLVALAIIYADYEPAIAQLFFR